MEIEEYLLLIAEKLGVEIEINPSEVVSRRPGALAVAAKVERKVFLTNWEYLVVAHELLHFLQDLTGAAIFHTEDDFRVLLNSLGIPVDEPFLKEFHSGWEIATHYGVYFEEEYPIEIGPFYVAEATNGWELFTQLIFLNLGVEYKGKPLKYYLQSHKHSWSLLIANSIMY